MQGFPFASGALSRGRFVGEELRGRVAPLVLVELENRMREALGLELELPRERWIVTDVGGDGPRAVPLSSHKLPARRTYGDSWIVLEAALLAEAELEGRSYFDGMHREQARLEAEAEEVRAGVRHLAREGQNFLPGGGMLEIQDGRPLRLSDRGVSGDRAAQEEAEELVPGVYSWGPWVLNGDRVGTSPVMSWRPLTLEEGRARFDAAAVAALSPLAADPHAAVRYVAEHSSGLAAELARHTLERAEREGTPDQIMAARVAASAAAAPGGKDAPARTSIVQVLEERLGPVEPPPAPEEEALVESELERADMREAEEGRIVAELVAEQAEDVGPVEPPPSSEPERTAAELVADLRDHGGHLGERVASALERAEALGEQTRELGAKVGELEREQAPAVRGSTLPASALEPSTGEEPKSYEAAILEHARAGTLPEAWPGLAEWRAAVARGEDGEAELRRLGKLAYKRAWRALQPKGKAKAPEPEIARQEATTAAERAVPVHFRTSRSMACGEQGDAEGTDDPGKATCPACVRALLTRDSPVPPAVDPVRARLQELAGVRHPISPDLHAGGTKAPPFGYGDTPAAEAERAEAAARIRRNLSGQEVPLEDVSTLPPPGSGKARPEILEAAARAELEDEEAPAQEALLEVPPSSPTDGAPVAVRRSLRESLRAQVLALSKLERVGLEVDRLRDRQQELEAALERTRTALGTAEVDAVDALEAVNSATVAAGRWKARAGVAVWREVLSEVRAEVDA